MKIKASAYAHLSRQCRQIVGYLSKEGTGTVLEMQKALIMNDARKRISEINGQYSAGLPFRVANYREHNKGQGYHNVYFLARKSK